MFSHTVFDVYIIILYIFNSCYAFLKKISSIKSLHSLFLFRCKLNINYYTDFMEKSKKIKFLKRDKENFGMPMYRP